MRRGEPVAPAGEAGEPGVTMPGELGACAACGAPVVPGQATCGACGADVSAAASQAAAPAVRDGHTAVVPPPPPRVATDTVLVPPVDRDEDTVIVPAPPPPAGGTPASSSETAVLPGREPRGRRGGPRGLALTACAAALAGGAGFLIASGTGIPGLGQHGAAPPSPAPPPAAATREAAPAPHAGAAAASPPRRSWGPVRRARLTPVFVRNDADDPRDVCFGPGSRPGGKVAWMQVRGERRYRDVVQCGSRYSSVDAIGVMRFRLSALRVPAGAKIVGVEGEFVFDESERRQWGSRAAWRVSLGGNVLCAPAAAFGASGRCRVRTPRVFGGGETLDIEQDVRSAAPGRAVWAGVFRPVLVYRAPR